MLDSLTGVVIANRGEIARRVIRTARRLGLPTVALYTPADADALHVREADEAVEVSSYLSIEEIAEIGYYRGGENTAVHPGYGFLSENSTFARELEGSDGARLVGPTAAVMDAMGRKDKARAIAVAAGVPVVPSYELGDDDPAGFAYPVLVKAAAGGGGKGMRVVRSVEEFDEACGAAAREAAKAFGDDTLLVEKFVESGRHIEVQVFGDQHGNVVHLFERDCSTQRRHQKVLEEAPAPTIGDEQRAAITSSAVDLAREVGYVGAGTVEFLLDNASGEFYFLEMNTRLQVEHPVTEEVVRVRGERLDLVELQLRIAAGEAMSFTQDEVTLDGHSIEARVYAEDAFGGFLPSAGTAQVVVWPQSARVDHALESGQVVSTSYDPMLGKVIVHAADREQARQALIAALDETAIFGFTTNVGFLRTLAASEEFEAASIDTGWLDRVELARPAEDDARALAAASLQVALGSAEPENPWQADGFRIGGQVGPLVEFGQILAREPGSWQSAARIEGDVWRVESGTTSGFVQRSARAVEVVAQGERFVFEQADPFAAGRGESSDGAITAPMPGTVLDVRVSEGQQVAEGDVLGVMEAMKMELSLKAPWAGVVSTVGAAAGEQVTLGTTLFVVEAGDE